MFRSNRAIAKDGEMKETMDMEKLQLVTDRLELIAVTQDMLHAELTERW